MAFEDTLRTELTLLRGELRELKKCQLAYFTLATGGSGLLLAIWGAANHGTPLVGLVVVLPCWWTFFDKATTITRLVGYVRVLEKKLAGRARHLGYETALAEFRRCEANDCLTKLMRHQYWTINWLTFLALSGVCLSLSIGRDQWWLVALASTAIFAAAASTLLIWGNLRWGRYTYEHVFAFWRDKVKP